MVCVDFVEMNLNVNYCCLYGVNKFIASYKVGRNLCAYGVVYIADPAFTPDL